MSCVAIGIFVAMLTLWLQSWLEWVFRQTYVTVEFYLLAGFVAALGRVDEKIRRTGLLRRRQYAWWEMARSRWQRGRSAYAPPSSACDVKASTPTRR